MAIDDNVTLSFISGDFWLKNPIFIAMQDNQFTMKVTVTLAATVN